MPRIVATVLIAGCALRAALTVALPPNSAYDDHFEPVRVILEKGRIPDAADCWECYQPPAYYLISAATWSVSEGLAKLGGAPQRVATEFGRKSMQWVSCAAGCLTLWLTLLVLRRAGIGDPAMQATALGIVAFLPAHIRISAMATNDALTHCVATAAILLMLRAHDRGWRLGECIAAGAAAGASVLCKAYGAVTVAAVVAAVTLHCWRSAPPTWRRFAPAAWTLLAGLLIGSGPALRNLTTFGKLQVDNFEKFDTPMRFQPPGAASQIDFGSLRYRALLESPWLHTRHLDSFWTELFGRLWFDYEGFRVSLSGYPAWEAHWKEATTRHPRWTRERWVELLSYERAETPPHFHWLGVSAYVFGLPLTLLVLCGVLVGAVRTLRGILARAAARPAWFATVLLTLHFFANLCVPVVQSLRLPVFSAMKVEFALSAVSSVAAAAALAIGLAGGSVRRVLLTTCGALLAGCAAIQTAYVLLQFLLARGG